MMHNHRFKRDAGVVAVIGGGPAGLTAAYELHRQGSEMLPIVFEAGDLVGGIARTESHNGFRFDIGGHRFFTKVPEVERMWHEVLTDDFIKVPRLSRIYYRGKFFDYPLKFFNALTNIGLIESVRIVMSYAKWRAFPSKTEDNFEEWVINRFGRRLYMHFFRSYTQKVWGIPPTEIRADWAAQRIKNLSLFKAIWNSISGANDTTSLIEEFYYPRLGPGMMWETTQKFLEDHGGEVHLHSRVERVIRDGNRVTAIEVHREDGAVEMVEADHFVNSMALRDLVERFDPPPPPEVVEAAAKLKYRDFLIVTLILDNPDPFPDNWVYVHSPDINVGRIQNFRAWSEEMVPDANKSSIGMEYFCNVGDSLWQMNRDELVALAAKELGQLGLAPEESVVDGAIIRQPKAYPVYDEHYQDALKVIADWINSLENFHTCGRNGLHRYNNQDHSMLTAMLVAENILGANHDVWNVNVERAYHEEFQVPKKDEDNEKQGQEVAAQAA
ncbi:MAG TPA: NAD(P)/FAD-dependent oxidoreductase [Alphaproteobacteria bacterium]|nr:NAD(P)/FAD-dependent oxidoreductase [Alphaproteobacteria bacterium]